MAAHTEIERKYEVDESAVMPTPDVLSESLAAKGSVVTAVVDAGTVELDADYFDTSGAALARHRIVVRRRRGGADEGWHVKRSPSTSPGIGDTVRLETQWPLTEGRVPDELLDTLRVYVRDHPLVPMAKIHTTRTLLHIRGADGAQLAEIADDRVRASDATTGIVRFWREWEVELLDGAASGVAGGVDALAAEAGGSALLDRVEQLLSAAGAYPASSSSKLASALGRTSLSDADAGGTRRLKKSSPASEVLVPVLCRLVDELCELDPRVRADEPDSVHQMRTRIRRLRSLFASYRDVFDRAVTDPVRVELAHLGEVLGHARDAEVMRDRVRGLIADHSGPGATFSVDEAKSLTGELEAGWIADYDAAHGGVVAELNGTRYFRLLDRLDELAALPPLAEGSDRPARDVVRLALGRDTKKVLSAANVAELTDTEDERIEALHEVRKAAKRLRYAAEAVTKDDNPVFGGAVRDLGAAAEGIHDLLGEHRDGSIMQQHLRDAAASSSRAFDHGVLFEIERHSAALCLADYPAALRVLKGLRRSV